MSKNSKLISNELREEIAKELGVYDTVKKTVEAGEMFLQKIVETSYQKQLKSQTEAYKNRKVNKKGVKIKFLLLFLYE